MVFNRIVSSLLFEKGMDLEAIRNLEDFVPGVPHGAAGQYAERISADTATSCRCRGKIINGRTEASRDEISPL